MFYGPCAEALLTHSLMHRPVVMIGFQLLAVMQQRTVLQHQLCNGTSRIRPIPPASSSAPLDLFALDIQSFYLASFR